MAIFEPLFEILESAKIRYVVVGGLAVVLHGHARLTADLDLILDLEPGEAMRAIQALVGAGYSPQLPVPAEQFADPVVRRRWIEDKGMKVFSLWNPDKPMVVIDLFVEHPIPFGELWERSTMVELETTRARVASIEDLIFLKEEAGRPKDLEDIRHLLEIREAQEEFEDDQV